MATCAPIRTFRRVEAESRRHRPLNLLVALLDPNVRVEREHLGRQTHEHASRTRLNLGVEEQPPARASAFGGRTG